MAWAIGDDQRFWWPASQYYWPPNFPRDITVENFVNTFRSFGYEVCAGFELEEGFEKIALYTLPDGSPTHMARQQADGTWTSKLGRLWDIQHKTLAGLDGKEYGAATVALRRARPAANPPGA